VRPFYGKGFFIVQSNIIQSTQRENVDPFSALDDPVSSLQYSQYAM
jgi:hypothetical protein